jgi:RNA polymerase sigma-70 factor (ECF subfamily)
MKPTFALPFSLPLAPADRRRLLDIARGLLGTQADAEDILHDAYLRAVTAPPVDVQAPLAWLTTVVKHLAVDGLRRRQLERGQASSPGEVASSAEDEAELLQRRAQALRQLADTLQPVEAAMLLLREVFEFSYAALAERSGKSEAACRQTVHRALLRLREGSCAEPEDRATADALYVLCLRAMQSLSPAPLHAILATTMSAQASAKAAVAAAAVSGGGIVQIDGSYALVLMHEGKPICCMPLGPVTTASVERI